MSFQRFLSGIHITFTMPKDWIPACAEMTNSIIIPTRMDGKDLMRARHGRASSLSSKQISIAAACYHLCCATKLSLRALSLLLRPTL